MLCGAVALGAASILSLLARMDVLQAQPITAVLYVVAVGVSVVEIRNEIVRRRFYAI